MSLITCPECGNTISDTAEVCPKCGFPLEEYVAEKEEEMPDIKMIDVDSLNNGDRNLLLEALANVESFRKYVYSWNLKLEEVQEKIDEEEEKAKEIENNRPAGEYAITLAAAAFVAIICGSDMVGLVWWFDVIIGIATYFAVFNGIIKPIDSLLYLPKRLVAANEYRESRIPALEEKMNQIYEKIGTIMTSEQGEWAKSVVGEDILNEKDLTLLTAFVKFRRADTLKEALIRFDDINYQLRIEKLLSEIGNYSLIAAEEAKKQTELEQESNERLGNLERISRKNFYSNWRTHREVKRIRRSL